MTIAPCPHGCGGIVDTAKSNYCESCRRGINETEIIVADDVETDGPTQRKAGWCWEWWGPSHHRMRCRLPKGHEGKHDTHEARRNVMIVDTEGRVIETDRAKEKNHG